jgi:hypothetical protein
MRLLRRHLPAAAVIAALALSVPVTGAEASPWPSWTPSDGTAAACLGSSPRAVNGAPGSLGTAVCGGVTIAFVGPQVGQIASAVGPTIIGAPVIAAPITVSNGPVQAVGP